MAGQGGGAVWRRRTGAFEPRIAPSRGHAASAEGAAEVEGAVAALQVDAALRLRLPPESWLDTLAAQEASSWACGWRGGACRGMESLRGPGGSSSAGFWGEAAMRHHTVLRRTSALRASFTLAVAASVLLSAEASAQTVVDIGGDRPAQLLVPSSYDGSAPVPLLLALHGCVSPRGGENVEAYLRFAPLAEELGFLYAAPNGTRVGGGYAWVACAGSDPAANSLYLASLIEEVETRFNVDHDRVYLVGYSDGGFMSYRFACDHPDLIVAFACLASSNLSNCTPSAPVPVLDVHGTADNSVAYQNGVTALERWVRTFWSAERTEHGAGPPIVGSVATSVSRWAPVCGGGELAELWTLTGAGHGPQFLRDGLTTRFARSVTDWLFARTRRELPRAELSVAPESGYVPVEVSADASASTAPDGEDLAVWCWSFDRGDEERGEQLVTHTFDRPGRHEVRVAVVTSDETPGFPVAATVTALCQSGDLGDLGSWSQVQIGAPAFPSAARLEASDAALELFVCAGGAPLSGSSDELLFIEREFVGDFVASVRLHDLAGGDDRSGAGLMVRAGHVEDAAFAAVLTGGTGELFRERLRFRQQTGARIRSRGAGLSSRDTAATWLRLERRGASVVGSRSVDGVDWEAVAEAELPDLPEAIRVGVVANGGDRGSVPFFAVEARLSTLDVVPLIESYSRGDANADGVVDISDGVSILDHLFLGSFSPPCLDAADTDDTGVLQVSDAVRVFGFLFLGQAPPPPPGQGSCGEDPMADALDCASFAPCSS